jgi:hypothetical protein
VIGTFKANNPYNTFLLLIYGLLLKLPMFVHPFVPKPQQTDGFLFKGILIQLAVVGEKIPIVYPIITFILLFTQAITFNQLVNEQRLMQKANYLTGMSYLLVTSLYIEWNQLSAPLLVNTLLVWVWARMSGLHYIKKPLPTLFNIGIAIGISTFFYFPSIAFTALIIFGLLFTRAFKIAEWLVALLGIITPYYFLAAYVFLTDKWKGYKFPGIAVSLPKFYQTNWAIAASIIVLITSFTGIYFINKNYRRQLVQTRKSWDLVFLYFFVALFVPFINASNSFSYWILCAIPLSAFIGCAFIYPKKNWVPLFYHWLIVAFVIAFSYFVR